MRLEDLLCEKRSVILDKWFKDIIATYPSGGRDFLANEKDRFHNPVGNIISEEIRVLFDALTGDIDSDRVEISIDNIMKMRSVQDFTSSQAVVIVFLLKGVVGSTLGSEIDRLQIHDQLIEFHKRIDGLALRFFDSYMSCREKINRLRIDEVKNKSEMLHKRMNISIDKSSQEGDFADGGK